MDRPREDENIQVFAKQKRQSIHIGRYEVDIVYVDSLGFLFIESLGQWLILLMSYTEHVTWS